MVAVEIGNTCISSDVTFLPPDSMSLTGASFPSYCSVTPDANCVVRFSSPSLAVAAEMTRRETNVKKRPKMISIVVLPPECK